MPVHASAIVAVGIVVAAFLLGSLSAWRPVRRMRNELAHIRRLAEHDPLTGLPNRGAAQRHFRLQAAAKRACSAVLVDLDGFKAVNDTWGHHAGDAHLTAVADRLAAGCRPIGGFAARLAGDEFLLLLPSADSNTVLRQVTTLLARLGAPLALPVDDAATIICTPGASAGIALAEPDATWSDLLRRADIALYQAKTRRGRATLYTPGMRHPAPVTPTPERAHVGPGGFRGGRLRGELGVRTVQADPHLLMASPHLLVASPVVGGAGVRPSSPRGRSGPRRSG